MYLVPNKLRETKHKVVWLQTGCFQKKITGKTNDFNENMYYFF